MVDIVANSCVGGLLPRVCLLLRELVAYPANGLKLRTRRFLGLLGWYFRNPSVFNSLLLFLKNLTASFTLSHSSVKHSP